MTFSSEMKTRGKALPATSGGGGANHCACSFFAGNVSVSLAV